MKVYGIGIEIINILRLKNKIIRNNNIKKRVFSPTEIKYCEKKIKTKYLCYSKRFAAKEAFSKSLGTGISDGISFKEIIVTNDKSGKPKLKLVGKTLKIVNKLFKNKKYKFSISLSDDKPIAIAIVLALYEK